MRLAYEITSYFVVGSRYRVLYNFQTYGSFGKSLVRLFRSKGLAAKDGLLYEGIFEGNNSNIFWSLCEKYFFRFKNVFWCHLGLRLRAINCLPIEEEPL